MSHVWDGVAGNCKVCGVTEDEFLNGPHEWGDLFCQAPPDKVEAQKASECCNKSAIVYLGGFWFCENCDRPNDAMNSFNSTKREINNCTCGAVKIFGENTPGHYNDCVLKERK